MKFEKICHSVDELSERTGWNRNQIYRLVKDGVLRSFKIGRRRYVSEEAALATIKALEQQARAG